MIAPMTKSASAASPRVGSDPSRDPGKIALRALPSWSSILAVAALLIVGVGIPVVIGAVSGALSVPRNDDPAYRRVALDLYSTGRLRFNAWSEMTLVGQIVFVQPFLWLAGGGAWAFAASTATLAAAGIVAGYALARRVLSVPRATLAVLGVLLFPGFLLNTTSFMTDVPAWSTEIICLWLGVVALSRVGRERWLWLAASLAVGCFAFSIREFTIAAPVAVLVAHAATPLWKRPGYWLSAAIVIVVCAAIYLLKERVPGARAVVGPDLTSISTGGLKEGIATLALILSPVLFLSARSWWRRLRSMEMLVGMAVGLVVGLVVYRSPLVELLKSHSAPRMILGNLIEPNGSMGLVALPGSRPLLFVDHSWAALNVAALVAGVLFLGLCGGVAGRALRSAAPLLRDKAARLAALQRTASVWGVLAVFTVLYAGGISAWSFVFPAYDRYLWPLVLPLVTLLLMPHVEAESANTGETKLGSRIFRGASVGASAVLLLAFASMSLGLLLNADAFDTARWRMGEKAVAGGANAATVDAGFEWVTFYATGLAVHAPAPALGGMYETRWPSFHLCELVSNSPLTNPELTLVDTSTNAYKLFLFGGPQETLYLYRVQGQQSCP